MDEGGVLRNLFDISYAFAAMTTPVQKGACKMAKAKQKLKGMGVEYSGVFNNISRNELSQSLLDMGAQLIGSVNTKTHLLIVGKRASSSKIDKARLMGIPILNEEQLMVLLGDGSLEDAIAHGQEEAAPKRDVDEVINELRHIMAEGATHDTWNGLCALLDQTDEDDLEPLLDYIIPHTEDWSWKQELASYWGSRHDLDVRRASEHWIQEMLTGKDSKKFLVVRSLQLHSRKLVGKIIKPIFDNDNLDNVLSLDVGRNKIPATFFKELQKREYWPNLQWLNLSHMKLNGSAIKALSGCHHLERLTHLMLQEVELDDEGLLSLLEAPQMCSLTQLDLSRNTALTDEGLAKIATIPHLSNLEVLVLEQTGFGDEALMAIAASPYLTNLKELRLQYTKIGTDGMEAFGQSDNSSGLLRLNVEDCHLRDAALRGLCEGKSTQLQELSVAYNLLTSRGASYLANASFASSLTSLGLSRNSIGDEGAHALAAASEMSALTSLSVGQNKLTDDGVNALLGASQFTRLEHLNIDHSQDQAILQSMSDALDAATHLSDDFRKRWRDYWLKSSG